MDEILEGEVGKSVTFEGKEYWIKVADSIKFEDIANLYTELDQPYRPYYSYYSPIIKNPKSIITLTGI
jgi:hypothetical protein